MSEEADTCCDVFEETKGVSTLKDQVMQRNLLVSRGSLAQAASQ